MEDTSHGQVIQDDCLLRIRSLGSDEGKVEMGMGTLEGKDDNVEKDREIEVEREMTRNKIRSLDPDKAVKLLDFMENLQRIREIFEDSTTMLRKVSSNVHQGELSKAIDLLSDGLKRYIYLQDTLLASSESEHPLIDSSEYVPKLEHKETFLELPHELKVEENEDKENCFEDDVPDLTDESGTNSEHTTEIKLESVEDICHEKPEENRGRTKSKKDSFSCDKCGRMFKAHNKYMDHLRRHTGEKPYKCDQCFKEFYLKGNLKEHMKIHSGEKLFQCNVCAKRFLLKSQLVRHMFIHSEDKPFKCEYCYKGCTSSGNLNRHRRTHTGEKPYTCDLCKKAFCDKNSLTDHKRIHSGEKPFQCETCNSSFLRKIHLDRHMRIHSGVKPFQCELCEKFFTRKENLKEHMKIHNRIKAE